MHRLEARRSPAFALLTFGLLGLSMSGPSLPDLVAAEATPANPAAKPALAGPTAKPAPAASPAAPPGPERSDAAKPAPETTREAVARLQREAQAAYKARDYAGFLEKSKQALALRPAYSPLLYNVACAYALLGRAEEAAAALDRLAARGLDLKPDEDPDFASIRSAKAFEQAIARTKRLREPLVRSEVAFTVDARRFLPEGIAHDPATGDFFVSSVHLRKVVKVTKAGKATDFSKPEDGLYAALALKIDPVRRVLWVTTAGLPQMRDARPEELGKTALLRYDLASGRLEKTFPLAPDAGKAHFDDLAIGPTGDVFVSESTSGAIYRLRAGGDALERFLEPGRIRSPNGVVVSADGKRLYVADYGDVIQVVDLETKAVTPLEHPDDVSLWTIDGLVADGRDLIAIQNGVPPFRVVRFTLNPRGAGVVKAEVLEQNHPRYVAPTHGVVAGDALYYVANSQWESFDKEGKLWPDEKLFDPVILKLPLKR